MILNARIQQTQLGVEDHGIFTAILHLRLQDGGEQGFGGYALDGKPANRGGEGRRPTAYGFDYIASLLLTLGVESWEKLPGTYCRIEKQTDSLGATITRIGHMLDNRWFDPVALAEKHRVEGV